MILAAIIIGNILGGLFAARQTYFWVRRGVKRRYGPDDYWNWKKRVWDTPLPIVLPVLAALVWPLVLLGALALPVLTPALRATNAGAKWFFTDPQERKALRP